MDQILPRIDSLICTLTNWQSSSITFIKSHNGSWPPQINKTWKKIRPIFLRSTSLLYKILPTNLGACNISFIHHIWVQTVLRGSVLSYRPRTEGSISQFCNTNCYHSIFRTIEARVGFSKTIKIISKITYTFCSASCGELRSNIITNLVCLIFSSWMT